MKNKKVEKRLFKLGFNRDTVVSNYYRRYLGYNFNLKVILHPKGKMLIGFCSEDDQDEEMFNPIGIHTIKKLKKLLKLIQYKGVDYEH